ncbi:hypothetical protein L5G28_08495 [Gordonia sp. HY285]|uniref:hypothetical protein n=1 Tax=Gordonia liuliyuniae TaxID=2911517 RepID=UPI001F1E77AB|nr:hypothetical protein [Gordonia liuliyuniae]MCF8610196.1 hypothetical protein [Gordonia liuliyuniae]
MSPITGDHLGRLARLAEADRHNMFEDHPRLGVFRSRVLLTALCQGAALHFVDGENGVKDLDVYTFYAQHPTVNFPHRRRKMVDFGKSDLGRHPDDDPRFRGRHVDLMGRVIDVPPSADPIEAVRDYLRRGPTTTSRKLAEKAVVVLDPSPLRGQVVWPTPRPDVADLN